MYDNRHGLDYHIRTTGATGASPRPMRVAHIAVEMAPIAKVGGLGDVVTSLGRAMMAEGHIVEVFLPKYDCLDYSRVVGLAPLGTFKYGSIDVKAFAGFVEELPVTFLEPQNGHMSAGLIYGRNDDALRFSFFCSAALAWLRSRPNASVRAGAR